MYNYPLQNFPAYGLSVVFFWSFARKQKDYCRRIAMLMAIVTVNDVAPILLLGTQSCRNCISAGGKIF
jgi:hypothetical protein